MLVLGLRVGEVMRIGNDVEVKVLRRKGNSMSVGIVAPREIPVTRQKRSVDNKVAGK